MIRSMRNIVRGCLKKPPEAGPISAHRDILSLRSLPLPRYLKYEMDYIAELTDCHQYPPVKAVVEPKVTGVTDTTISLEWSYPYHAADGFLMRFSSKNLISTIDLDSGSKYVDFGDGSISTILDGLHRGREYTIRVYAINAFGESPPVYFTGVTGRPPSVRWIFADLISAPDPRGGTAYVISVRGYGFTPGISTITEVIGPAESVAFYSRVFEQEGYFSGVSKAFLCSSSDRNFVVLSREINPPHYFPAANEIVLPLCP
jgi:fibronectin type III domain protein